MFSTLKHITAWAVSLEPREKFTSYYASELTAVDEARFGHKIGDPARLLTWECLAVLVELRLWPAEWRHSSVLLRVRSDSVAALYLLLTLKGAGKGPTIIGEEMALDVGRGSFRPDVAIHLPPFAYKYAGIRWYLPSHLRGVPRAVPPARDASYS